MKNDFLCVLSALAAIACLWSCRQEPEKVVNGNGTASSVFEGTVDYDRFFTSERLRVDLVLSGDASEEYAFVSEFHKEPHWSGSPNSLIERFGYGQCFYEMFAGDSLIFSQGFCPLFEEWRTTAQARQMPMAANQSIWMPFPKQPVRIVLYQRVRATGIFEPMLEFELDPSDRHIVPGPDNDYRVTALQYRGEPTHKADLVICGEGYTASQMAKLRHDAFRMMDYMFSMEPYASRRDDWNVWLVENPSEDEGVDIPQQSIWRRTPMDAMFDTFYIDRYLTIMDHKKIASVVSGADFDAVFVLVNETKYGGGGMYGSYAMGTSDHKYSQEVFIHEFGHSFAALGDEYFDSETAYEDYYPLDVEPWEPNITTKVDFSSKWEDMMGEDGVGLYEGAGYMAHGCWRPYEECRMFNNTAPGFCPVCRRAIDRMIDRYVQ